MQTPTKAEQQFLHESVHLVSLGQTQGWKMLKEEMARIVQEASSDMRGNVSSDPVLRSNLMWRWQVIDAFKKTLENYVETAVLDREELLNDLEPKPGESDSYEAGNLTWLDQLIRVTPQGEGE